MDIIELIDVPTMMALYDVRSIGRNSIAKNIARKLNLTPRTALRKIQSLEKASNYKLKFSIEYSLRALNLKSILLLFRNDSILKKFPTAGYFLRATFPVVPFGGGLTFYAPIDETINLPTLNDKDFLKFEYTLRLSNRVDLVKYGIRSIIDPAQATSSKVFEILRKDINLYIDYLDKIGYKFDQKEKTSSRFMWLDLIVIKELEKNPFASLEELANCGKTSISKILRHYRRDIINVLRGIRVRYLPVYRQFDAGVITKVRYEDPLVLRAFGEALIRNPLSPAYVLSLTGKEGLIHILTPFSVLRSALRNLISITREYNIDIDVNNVWLLAPGGKRFTIPYIKWEEYIPKVKWNVTLLKQLIRSELMNKK